jgi:MFS family permease
MFEYPSGKELERNRLLGIFEGAAARVVFNLTSGAFLVGFLKYMGASDSICGYILAIPVLAAGIQFLSPIVLESLPFRKRIIIIGASIQRILLSSLIFIPFIPLGTKTRLWATYIVFFIAYLSAYFINPAVSNMYVSFVPQNIRGGYFGGRESYILLTSAVVTLILGKILDNFTYGGNAITGYIVVYIVVFVFTLINVLSYHFMKEVPLEHSKERIKISEIFTVPFRNKKFVSYFLMLIIWNIASQIASAYFSVYLKSDLSMNYTTITVLSMINSLVYIFCARKWGRFADKKGWSVTTMLTVGILSICHTIWFFTSKGSPFVLALLLITHVISGIAWSGINIAFFNMQFDYSPDEKRTVYIGLSSAASGIIGYIAAVVGSQLVSIFGSNPIMIFGRPFDIKQILFLTSAVLLQICSLYIRFCMNKQRFINNEEAAINV